MSLPPPSPSNVVLLLIYLSGREVCKIDFLKKYLMEGLGGDGGVLPYMSYIGMCRCEGYGFQAPYSRIGYIN